MTKPEAYMSGSLRMAWLVVCLAVITATGFALDLAWHRFYGLMFFICATGLVAVVLAEVLCWHQTATSWHQRRVFSCGLWLVLASVCSLGTLYTNYSTSALGQDEKAVEKLSSFNAYDDLSKSEKEAADKVSRLEKQLAQAPSRTSDAAQAAIDNAMAHKFWKSTDGCKETKGQQTRDFCAQYAAAVADKSNASASVQARAELANAEGELKSVREKRGSTKAETSKDNPAILLLTTMGLQQDHARLADSMVLPLVVQFIMALGGILLANEHARDKEPKSWLPEWLSNWAKGRAYVAATGRQMQTPAEVYAKAAEQPTPLQPQVFRSVIGISGKTVAQQRAEEQREEDQKRLAQLASRPQEAS